jgi:hypothetical protein
MKTIEKSNPEVMPGHKEVLNPMFDEKAYYKDLEQNNPKKYHRVMKLRATRERQLENE